MNEVTLSDNLSQIELEINHHNQIAEFAQDFYEEFDLGTYSDLQKGQVKQAEEYIREWETSTNTKRKINQLNNQIELFAVN